MISDFSFIRSLSAQSVLCKQLFSATQYFKYDLRGKQSQELKKSLPIYGINKSQLFTQSEKEDFIKGRMVNYNSIKVFLGDPSKARVRIKIANPELKLNQGDFFKEKYHGVTLIKSNYSNLTRTQNLSDSLRNTVVNEMMMTQNNTYQPDRMIVQDFLERLRDTAERTKLKNIEYDYIEMILNEMITSARLVTNIPENNPNLRLKAIVMRWKPENRNIYRDPVKLHIDPGVKMVSTLALLGYGTEFIETENNDITLNIVEANNIVHMTGELGKEPTFHRSSRSNVRRIVFLIAWE
jgi:hypothetical protein